MEKKLSHIDTEGLPGMVDVSEKANTTRMATGTGSIFVGKEIMNHLISIDHDTKKGSIIQTAIIAGTMAVKNTSNTIPLCHHIPVSSCKIKIYPKIDSYSISCTVKTISQTGVEMEALHGVSVAALTIYDMVKAMGHEMVISEIRLESKSGGKKDYERKAP